MMNGPPSTFLSQQDLRRVVQRATGERPAGNVNASVVGSLFEKVPYVASTLGAWKVDLNVDGKFVVTAVLKVLHHGAPQIGEFLRLPVSSDMQEPLYWRREAAIYETESHLALRGSHVRTPDCLQW